MYNNINVHTNLKQFLNKITFIQKKKKIDNFLNDEIVKPARYAVRVNHRCIYKKRY